MHPRTPSSLYGSPTAAGRGPAVRRVARPAAALALVLCGALTACGSTPAATSATTPPAAASVAPAGPSSAGASAPVPPRAGAPTTAPTTAPTNAPGSATPRTTASPPASSSSRCHTSQLHGSVRDQVRTGETLDLIVTNTSRQTCTVQGYPGLGFLTADRHDLRKDVSRGSTQHSTDHGPSLLRLLPGQSASATAGTGPCDLAGTPPSVGFLEITPPDERDFLLAPVPTAGGLTFGPCELSVTALVAGSQGSHS